MSDERFELCDELCPFVAGKENICFDNCVNSFRTDFMSNPDPSNCKKICTDMYDKEGGDGRPDEMGCCVNECNKVLDDHNEGWESKGAILLDDESSWFYKYYYPKSMHGNAVMPDGSKFTSEDVEYVAKGMIEGKKRNGKKYPKHTTTVGNINLNRCNAYDIYTPYTPVELEQDADLLSQKYCFSTGKSTNGWRFATCARKAKDGSCKTKTGIWDNCPLVDDHSSSDQDETSDVTCPGVTYPTGVTCPDVTCSPGDTCSDVTCGLGLEPSGTIMGSDDPSSGSCTPWWQ